MSCKSAPQLLWPILAAPERADCEAMAGPCWLCGAPWGRGQPVRKWSGASFTGQNRVRCITSSHVCEPCVQVCSRVAPVPGRPPKPGKKFGGNFRNYSHLYANGDYTNASKGEKPAILDWLTRPKQGPWFAAIADSGQKHVLPWVPVNAGSRIAGRVLFDEAAVELPQSFSLVGSMAHLLTCGATKEEIARGDYRVQTWLRCQVAVEMFEHAHRHERGGSWWGLALWLAQRDEAAVKERLRAEKEAKKNAKAGRRATRKAANKDGRDAARAARRISRVLSQRAHTLHTAEQRTHTHATDVAAVCCDDD